MTLHTSKSEMRATTTLSRRGFLVAAGSLTLAGVAAGAVGIGPAQAAPHGATVKALPTRADIVAEFGRRRPTRFGLFVPGMVRHGHHGVALTFDACGGHGNGYDAALISRLRTARVPATLFLNSRWIRSHRSRAAELAADPLFEIGNHGWLHRPLTVAGQAAYGIAGTRSAGECYDEIMRGFEAVAELTGRAPLWYRPGTAWADDIGMAIAHRLGLRVASFSINADAGATASAKVVARKLKAARSQAIVIGHMNHPHGRTAEGLAKALAKMKRSGRHYVRLTQALG